jgi:hypothetical protein
VDVEFGCRYPRTCVLGNVQPSPFDKLRAGSSGLVPIFPWPVTGPPRAVHSSSSKEPIWTRLFSNRMKKDNGGSEDGDCRVNHEPAHTAGHKFLG